MKKALPLLSLLFLLSSSRGYMSTHAQKVFRKHRHSKLYVELARQVREKNVFFSNDTTGRVIFIQPVMARRGGVGIYAYSSYGTHFGTVSFFSYNGTDVTLLDRQRYEGLQSAVADFLEKEKFNALRVKRAKKTLKKCWELNSSDSF